MKMYKSGERSGCDVYISDTSLLATNYMSLANHRLSSKDDTVVADITHLSESMFVGKLADWLWDNCFNSWIFIERARQNALYQWYSDYILRFDAESDAEKFQEYYNQGWSYGSHSQRQPGGKRMSDPNRKNPLDKTS